MTYLFILFIWSGGVAYPALPYSDSEKCWADATSLHDEGYSVECRAATLASPIMGLAPTTSPRPRARPVIPALPE